MKRWRVPDNSTSLLRMAREITGLPLKDIGAIIGMPRSTVSSIVNGYAHEWLSSEQVSDLMAAMLAYRDLTIRGIEEMEAFVRLGERGSLSPTASLPRP